MIKLGLLGKNLKKSMSGVLYSKLSKLIKTDIYFKLLDVSDIKKAITLVKKEKFSGFYVTMPYKRDILKFSILDKYVQKTECANCIKISKNKLYATNTDLKALRNIVKHDIKNAKSLIIGNGATAQTSTVFLLEKGVKDITIAARNPEKNLWFKKFSNIKFTSLDKIKEGDWEIIINATPIGMHFKKKLKINIKNAILVIDFAYSDNYTDLIKNAIKQKVKAIDGIEILANQALEGLEFISSKKSQKYVKKLIKYLKRRL